MWQIQNLEGFKIFKPPITDHPPDSTWPGLQQELTWTFTSSNSHQRATQHRFGALFPSPHVISLHGCQVFLPAGVSAAWWLGSSTASSTTLMLWLCITSCSMLKISSARAHLKAKMPEHTHTHRLKWAPTPGQVETARFKLQNTEFELGQSNWAQVSPGGGGAYRWSHSEGFTNSNNIKNTYRWDQ